MKSSIAPVGEATAPRTRQHRWNVGTIAPVCLAVIMAGVAGSASAFTFSPPHTAFTLDSFANGYIRGFRPRNWSCGLTISAKVNKDGSISTIESFFSSDCPLSAPNLPWKVAPENASTAVIKGFSFVFDGHTCGPSNVDVAVNSSGVWTINSSHDGCQLEYISKSVPAITIAP